MQIITLLNEKGGVGKTSQAIHLAAGLAIRDARVLLIDTDPQANATGHMRIPASDGAFRLLAQEAEWRDVLLTIDPEIWAGAYPTNGSLWLLPSHVNNRVIPMVVDDPDLFAERLDELRELIDYVIIDTPPTPSMLHTMIYRCSDYILMPTQFDIYSLEGLAKTAGRVAKEREIRPSLGLPPLHLLGIQPTMYRRTNAHEYGMSEVTAHFGPDVVWPPMALRTAWSDAAGNGKTLYADSAGSEAELEAWSMVDHVMRRVTATTR